MATPGVTVRPIRQMTGDHEFCEVFLDQVRVPRDALLGPLHGGWQVAMEVLTDERGSSAAGLISLERGWRSCARSPPTTRRCGAS